MIKKNKTLFIFVGILLLLVIAYFALTNINKPEDTGNVDIAESIPVLTIDKNNIDLITIKNEKEEYSFSYIDKTPVLVGKEYAALDLTAVDALSYELSEVKATMLVKENAESLEPYGLVNEINYVTIKEKSGVQNKIILGNKAPGGNGYYIRLNNESKVYLIPIHKGEIILKESGLYRQSKFFEIDKNSVEKLIITKPQNEVIEFVKNVKPEGSHNVFSVFDMTSPYKAASEGSQVSIVLDSLVNFAITDYVDDNPTDLDKYGLNPYTYKVEVVNKGVLHTIYLGKAYNNNRYVKIDNDKSVYGVSNSLFGYLDLKPIAFIQKSAYIKNIDTVSKISYNHADGAKGEFAIKIIDDENHEITLNGKPMDQKDFKTIYTELISINIAGDTRNKITGSPTLEYTFTFVDGSSENVKYYKIDERKYALSVDGLVQFYVSSNELNERLTKIDEIIKRQ